MANINIYNILSYGAIGLSCILALAAYSLLRKEQDKERPRKQILTSVYIFMSFSLLLTILGFFRENVKDKNNLELESNKNTNAEKLKSARQIVRVLLDQKEGKVRQLAELTINDSLNYYQTLKNIVLDLSKLDSAMTEVIKDEETK